MAAVKHFVIPTGASVDYPFIELSSRPERSGVERPAVHSVIASAARNRQHFSPAQRDERA